MVTYKGYPIRKRQTGYKSYVWDVMVEEHDRDHITGKEIIKERVTYTGKTLDECKQAINAHFGRL